jgi:predicted enzyme related to lactoylglutathione lyase
MNERNDPPPTTAPEHSVDARLARPGAITYLHIPASDVRQAAVFYRDVFDWKVSDPDSDRPSFDDASGQLSGAWISDHLAATAPGLLPYIYVDHVEATVTRILAHGGEIVAHPYPEGRLIVATFRDPAGNTIGLWHDTTRNSPRSAQDRAATDTDADPGRTREAVTTSIQPELWVEPTSAAAAFYLAAFGATVIHRVGEGDDIVAQLSVDEAAFWVAPPSPAMKRLNPQTINGTTSRTLLVVADPDLVLEQAVRAGATQTSPVGDEHGWRLGRIVDPFGHEWEIGKPLGTWPPA